MTPIAAVGLILLGVWIACVAWFIYFHPGGDR